MNKREPWLDENQVEVSDLDPGEFPRSVLAQRLAGVLDGGLRGVRSRRGLFLCALMAVVLVVVLANQLPGPASQKTAGDSGRAATVDQPSLALFPSGQIAYVQAPDNTVTAYRSSDGHVLWRRKLASAAAMSATSQALYCVFFFQRGGLLEALDARNGGILWSQALPSPGSVPSLLVKDGTVYTGTQDGWLEARRTSDGKKLWRYRFAQDVLLPLDHMLVVKQGMVLIEAPGGVNTLLRASDGREILKYIANAGPPPVDGGIVYLFLGLGPDTPGESDGTIQALRTDDGKLLWQYTLRGSEDWSPVEIAGTVYAGAVDGSLLAFQGTNGRQLWTYRAQRPVIGAPTGQDGRVYALLQDGTVVALRAQDGARLWQTRIDAFAHILGYTPILEGGQLFLSDLAAWGNVVYALRASDGSVLWHHEMGSDDPLHAPVLFDGIFYLSQNDGSLDAWRASDGVHLWRYLPPFPTDWIWPEATSGLLYVKSLNGLLTILQASTGVVRWSSRAP